MRLFTFILLLGLLPLALLAQPSNDDCGGATQLNLTSTGGCPNTSTVTDFFSGTNVDATPISPYPLFNNCPSGANSGPANEVWFTFTATANSTTITVSGLSDVNIVFYRGTDCISLQAIDCTGGGGTGTVTANTLIGNTYFFLVSGGDTNDEGNFNIQITGQNACGACTPPEDLELTLNPPPINGTYSSGQEVQVCAIVNTWNGNAAGTIEYIHAATFDFGPGWDVGTLVPNPPGSCDGTGTWDWYDSWTSCATGVSFGPGFGYDSSLGIGCGGSPNDGDPGNNHGDGYNGCDNRTSPIEFCMNINVRDCPPAFTGDDLGINIQIWSDGESGNWNLTGCNSGQSVDITSAIVCCDDVEPLVTPFDTSCPGAADGYIEIQGNGGFDPTQIFNIFVFNDANQIVYECLGCSDIITTDQNLPPGSYTVSAVNVATDCARSTAPFDINDPLPNQANITNLNPNPCPNTIVQLQGGADVLGAVNDYDWTGPNGESYNGEIIDVTDAGTYELIVTVDGCPSEPADIEVTFIDFDLEVTGETFVCEGVPVNLQATGDSDWQWTDMNTGQVVGTSQTLDASFTSSTTLRVTALDANGCFDEEEVDLDVSPSPIIQIETFGTLCSNEIIEVVATGAETYVWQDDFSTANPRLLTEPAPGNYTLEVVGTDAFGCTGTGILDITVNEPSDVSLIPDNSEVCVGEEVTITAVANTGDIDGIEWITVSAPDNQNPVTITITEDTEVVANTVNTNACFTLDVVTNITVIQPPADPVISCGASTPNSVTFNWTAILDATSYEIRIDGGAPFQVTDPTHTVDNLAPNTDVTISVLPLGNNFCPTAPVSFQCSTLACGDFNLAINSVDTICLTASTATFDLTFTADSGPGTFTWAGSGITNVNTGTFDPNVAGIGDHLITLTYTDGDCVFSDTETIVVHPTPIANFSLSNIGPLCNVDVLVVTFTGSAGSGATYDWDFDGANVLSGSNEGPYELTWNSAGTPTITLMITENGCISNTATQSVTIDEPLNIPVIQCTASTVNSVTFTWNPTVGADNYTVETSTGQTEIQTGTSFTVDNLSPGQVVVVTVTPNVVNTCGPFTSAPQTCTAQNCPSFIITPTPIDPICLTANSMPVNLMATVSNGNGNGTFSWSGPGVVGNSFDPQVAGVDTHTLTVTYTEGDCSNSTTLEVIVNAIPTADFSVTPTTVCTDTDVRVTYIGSAVAGATYTWNFAGGQATPGTGVGPHTVSWPTAGSRTISLTVTENNCPSEVFTQTVEVDAPLAEPVINCTPTTSSIIFNWDAIGGAIDYEVNILNGPAGATGVLDAAARTFTVTGLQAGETVEIEVIAVGDGSCGNSSNTFSCAAQDCPIISISIDSVAPLCFTNSLTDIDLEITRTGGAGGGTETWSGDGIVDATTGIFSPVAAGVGSAVVSVTYEEGNCSYTASRTIVINAIPTATFTATSPICQTDDSEIIYTGSAGNAATYTWNFDGGQATPGTGVGPHTVSWDSPGSRTISLTVTENECVSEVFTQTVEVDALLTEAVINCTPTTNNITFSWDAVSGATDYEVNILSGPAGAMGVLDAVARTFTVNGLQAGETVEIEVIAVGDGSCGNSRNTFSCAAQNCPMISISIDSVAPLCFTNSLADIDLEITRTGGAGGGTETWSGDGIVDATTGVFSPITAGIGASVVSVTYEEGNCSYTASRTIVINAIPTATFTATSPICETDNSEIVYTGSAGNAATYAWNFDGGQATPGTGVGPHTVSWDSPGSRTISLVVTENECVSEVFTQTVEVDALLAEAVINCTPTTSSITFSWDAVSGSTDYEVNILNGPAGATGILDPVARTFTVTGLQAGETVEIEVIAVGDSSCGNSRNTFSCTAQDCPMVSISIDSIAPLCFTNNLPEIDLAIMRIGGAGGGTETWSGNGIVDAATGVFSPVNAGIGTSVVSVTYEEGNCSYTASRTIVIHAIPTATFTATSPICQTDNSEIIYTGSAGNEATYTWDFAGGQATPGTGVGPHTVVWDSPGSQDVSLTVTENNCASEPFIATVMVSNPLIAPVISCNSDNTSIVFSWPDVVGATGYQVNILTAPAGSTEMADIANRTYSFTNLNPGDEVSIELIVETDNVCGSVSASQTCTAQSCVPFIFGAETYGPFCADTPPQTLVPAAQGSSGGRFSWSGPGITDATLGSFDPSLANLGENPINLVYEVNGCLYDTTYQIAILPVPDPGFSVTSPICLTETATITFDGNASATADYNWDFAEGTVVSGTDAGPYEISWTDSGNKLIQLSIEDNGCSSSLAVQEVMVQDTLAPVEIRCAETSVDAVTFSWEPVTGADNYTVTVIDGPTGTLIDNTYRMTGLSPNQSVTIEVTAIGDTVCGPSTAQGTCLAQACQPLTLSLDGPTEVCSGEDISLVVNIAGGQSGPFTLNYLVNGTAQRITGISNGDALALGLLTDSVAVTITEVIDESNTICSYAAEASINIAVTAPNIAGTDYLIDPLCVGIDTILSLLSPGTTPNGNITWTETSIVPSTANAFDPQAGTFNTSNQLAGTYTFELLASGGSCPDAQAITTVILVASPAIDAGADQELTCNMGLVSIGDNGSSQSGLSYTWTVDNANAVITDPTLPLIDVSSPGTYTLTVANAAGCTSSDEVVVSSAFDVPVADVSISEVSCFQAADGAILIDEVNGGQAPYTFSLNGGTPTSSQFFGNLSGDSYILLITDANGCFTELEVMLIEPTEVSVQLTSSLTGRAIIETGDTVTLTASYDPNIPIDTIIWQPDSIGVREGNNLVITPQETTTYTVTIRDINGCSDTDEFNVIVRQDRKIFMPTAFSPDGNEVNDYFYVQGGDDVKEVKSFLVFNRWGESMFENYNFAPNDITEGWDGRFREQLLNTGVFVYSIEVEYTDGEVVLFKGDVVLMR